jgi:Membrane-bound serine protease (ClpP class)
MLLIITLVLIGIVLLLIELLIIPGVGIAGIIGLLALVAANVVGFMYYPQPVGAIVLFVSIAFCTVVTIYALRAKTWKRFSLKHNIEEKAIALPVDLGISVGMRGKTLGRLTPAGKARFGQVDVEVYAMRGIIPPSTDIEVVQIEDLRIFVVSVENPENNH